MPHALQTAAQVLPSFHHASLGLALLDGQSLTAEHWLVLIGWAVLLSLIIVWRHKVQESHGLA